ncbi:MAG: hypothetical protein COB53_04795 [Elusimicrobia bacterium]|nr:MAG: hypothetical protein COB53_04795 [Elusimicrobiota bacterium]
MLDLEFTRFKNRNVLFYPRMSGIGDCFPVMGAGLARFSGEPFILACGMISPLIKIAYPHYAKFYSELFAPFDLCEEVIFHDGEYLDDVEETLEAYLACGANVYFLKDSLPLNHGYKDTFENLEMIQERFSDHYHPTAMGAAGALDCGRINICFQIRHSSGIRGMKKKYQNRFLERNVDLEKWISFLVWVADSFDIRLIGIGDSNPESPWHIPGHKLAPLLIHPNIRMPAWTHGTTLAEDLYLLHASDIFIGTHSGPQILSWLTQKPTLCFDYGERGSEINFLRRSGSPLQRTFWDRQSLDQMKELFADYMENAFARFGRARRPW